MPEWNSNNVVIKYCQLAGLSVTSNYSASPSTEGSWKLYKQVPVYRELSESERKQQEDAQMGMLNGAGLYWPPEDEVIEYTKEFIGTFYPPDKFISATNPRDVT